MKNIILPSLLLVILNPSSLFADSTNHFHGKQSHSHPLPSTGTAHKHEKGATDITLLSPAITTPISTLLSEIPKNTKLYKIKEKYEQGSNSFLTDYEIDYLRQLSRQDNIQAQLILAAMLDRRRITYRINMVRGIQYLGEEQYNRIEKNYRDNQDELFSLYKKLHASLGKRYAYQLAEMAIFDGLKLDNTTNIKALLESSYGHTNGMSEALMALLLINKGSTQSSRKRASELFNQSSAHKNPYSLAITTRKNLLGNNKNRKSDSEALPLLLDVKKAIDKYWWSIDYNYYKDIDYAWDRPWFHDARIWRELAKSELRILLGPVAFREATRLSQTKKPELKSQAIELYRLSSSNDIQKAHMALAYFYKHGEMGLPKSADYAETFFFKAYNCSSDEALGVYNCNDTIRITAAKEYKKINTHGASSEEVLAILGIGLLLLGQLAAHTDITPDTDNWMPGVNHMQGLAEDLGTQIFLDQL